MIYILHPGHTAWPQGVILQWSDKAHCCSGQALEALSADDDSLVHHRKGTRSKRADELPWNKSKAEKKRLQRESQASLDALSASSDSSGDFPTTSTLLQSFE